MELLGEIVINVLQSITTILVWEFCKRILK